MFSVTNRKVAGFFTRWAEFRGFSILFDNPGDCLRPRGPRLDLACDVNADQALGLYRMLRECLMRLDTDVLTSTYLFCALPSHSYHVTAWDGINADNLHNVSIEHRASAEAYLEALPDSVAQAHAVTSLPLDCPLVQRRDWSIEFRFDSLAIWGDSVLVARLAPTSTAQPSFDTFIADRQRLNNAYQSEFGVAAGDRYTPHVSLGYFGNREGGRLARALLRDWNEMFDERTQGLTIRFESAGVYGFTDMATFFTHAYRRSSIEDGRR